MTDSKGQWQRIIGGALEELAGQSLPIDEIAVETPPDPGMGDLGFPMFAYARHLKKAPPAIAAETAALLQGRELPGTVEAAGPYVNVRLSREAETDAILSSIEADPDRYGNGDSLAGQKIMIEFSSPNTNKPLHMGHLRNDALGMSVSRLLRAMGGTVQTANLINDRGVHICKSMLAYRDLGDGKTPESEGVKGDHFVGDYYVRFETMLRQDASVEGSAREMLILWEQGDEPTTEMWEKMNGWTLEGIE
jgi:arginyl-tRNA synthetase